MPNPHNSELQGSPGALPIPFGSIMVLALFRRHANRRAIERLRDAIIAAARREPLYDAYGVADTVDGRFELLVLHTALLVRRLDSASAPGPDIAQDLTDNVFRHLDSSLREVGIGDAAVPKRMKKLAQAFYGRANAYASALASDDDALAQALHRNVYAGRNDADGRRLARYVRAAVARLDTLSVDDVLVDQNLYPDPNHIA